MKCQHPEIQDSLLNTHRSPSPAPSALHMQHLEQCEACQDALFLMSRAREHFDDGVSSAELARLKLRVMPRATRTVGRSPRPKLVQALAGLGATAALAAAAAAAYQTLSQAPPESEPATKAPQASEAAKNVQPRAMKQSTAEVVEKQEPPAPTVKLRQRVAPTTPPAKPAPTAASLWNEAADALKQKDTPRAEKALSTLARSSNIATRHSAELSLVEIWFKTGRSAKARATLQRLANSGATPAIRQRANKLLTESNR